MAPASGDRGRSPGGVAQGTLETVPEEREEEGRKKLATPRNSTISSSSSTHPGSPGLGVDPSNIGI